MEKRHLRINLFPWNSLRVRDQPILAANLESEFLLNVAVVCNQESKTYRHGFPRYSALQKQFHAQCLGNLRNSLKKLGSDLFVLNGVQAVGKLMKILNSNFTIDGLVTMTQFTREELDLIQAFNIRNTVIVNPNTLVQPDCFQPVDSTFTKFRKRVQSCTQFHEVTPDVLSLKELPELPDEALSLRFELPTMAVSQHPNTAFPFSGGESAAWDRLISYTFGTNAVSNYKSTRNGMIGTEYSTKFSPFLAYGCISPSQIMQQVKIYEEEFGGNESTYWVFFELLWRDYFILIARDFGDRIYRGLLRNNREWNPDYHHFQAWCNGNTGVPFIDANMRELKLTGYMSNRGRQNVASFLVNDLKIDWTLGAEYFESVLLDFDVSSNYGNWMYLAGVGNDPRDNRYFNVVKQARDYDPDGEYIVLWCPELKNLPKKSRAIPWVLENQVLKILNADGYPYPIFMGPRWAKHY
jgi:deoxyribodipyrimidine photo-lyase